MGLKATRDERTNVHCESTSRVTHTKEGQSMNPLDLLNTTRKRAAVALALEG